MRPGAWPSLPSRRTARAVAACSRGLSCRPFMPRFDVQSRTAVPRSLLPAALPPWQSEVDRGRARCGRAAGACSICVVSRHRAARCSDSTASSTTGRGMQQGQGQQHASARLRPRTFGTAVVRPARCGRRLRGAARVTSHCSPSPVASLRSARTHVHSLRAHLGAPVLLSRPSPRYSPHKQPPPPRQTRRAEPASRSSTRRRLRRCPALAARRRPAARRSSAGCRLSPAADGSAVPARADALLV